MIDKDRIKAEAEAFFEWPTADKTHVTTTSMLIFCESIVRMAVQAEREALYSGEQVAELRSEVEELRAQNAAWRKQCDTLTHQVICCGVAASHPDAALTTRGAYAGKWNSAQAEEVRKLRADRDRLSLRSPFSNAC